jgi:tyrosinase
MKLLSLAAGLLSLAHLAIAAPVGDADPEVAASKRILELQAQYQQNIFGAIDNRTTGCTAQNIQRRKEW